MHQGVDIHIRQAGPEDVSLIYSTWLLGLRFGNGYFREIKKSSYFDKYKHVVTALLHRSHVSVACLASDPDVVLGYAVYSTDTLHWVFVKKSWRKLGIAKRLVPSSIRTASHTTLLGKKLMPSDWEFDPFL
jgi:GNAT superfamily N-acetyltransferase